MESIGYDVGVVIGAVIGVILLIGIPIFFIVSLVFAIRQKTTVWIIMSIISGFLSLILFGLFSYGVYKGISSLDTYTNNEAVVPENRVIVSLDSLCQITIPEHWTLLNNLHDDASMQAGNLSREEYLIVLNDYKMDFAGSLEEHVDITLSTLMSNIGNAVVENSEHIIINGYRAIRHKVRGDVDRTTIVYLQTTIEGDNAFYQIISWTLPSKEEISMEIFKNTILTFKER
jgi:hypothetical protein